MTNQFRINYIDSDGVPQGMYLHKPYPNSANGSLTFDVNNFSFRSGHYDSYVDGINDETITLRGFEDTTAMAKFTELGIVADEGYEIAVGNLSGALNGVYIIESLSYSPIGLDVFEYNLTLKYVRAVTPWSLCYSPDRICYVNGYLCGVI